MKRGEEDEEGEVQEEGGKRKQIKKSLRVVSSHYFITLPPHTHTHTHTHTTHTESAEEVAG